MGVSDPIRVMVGIPNEGHTQAESYYNRLMLAFHLGKLEAETGKFQFYWATAGRMFTPLAREKLVESALEVDAEYVFMMDDDMLTPIDLFERLYRHDVDLVAPLAFARTPPYSAVIYRVREGYDPVSRQEYFVNEWVRNYPKDKLVECDAVGFGSVLFKTSILKKMQAPYFMSSCGLGEDILFCHRARKSGAKIFMDTTTKLGHLTHPIVVDEQFSEDFTSRESIEKLFGPYDRAKVIDVITPPKGAKDEEGNRILSGANA